MAAAQIHVMPDGDRWSVRRDGDDEALSTHDRQEDAIAAGRRVASDDGAEFLLHGADGRIREKDSYGNDPRDIPG